MLCSTPARACFTRSSLMLRRRLREESMGESILIRLLRIKRRLLIRRISYLIYCNRWDRILIRMPMRKINRKPAKFRLLYSRFLMSQWISTKSSAEVFARSKVKIQGEGLLTKSFLLEVLVSHKRWLRCLSNLSYQKWLLDSMILLKE